MPLHLLMVAALLALATCGSSLDSPTPAPRCPPSLTADVAPTPAIPDNAVIPLAGSPTAEELEGLAAFLEAFRSLAGHDREMTARAIEGREWCRGLEAPH